MLDQKDHLLLKLLQDNSRISASEAGEELELSVPAASERIKKLLGGGYIKKFTAQLDSKKLGLDLTAFISVDSSSSSHYEDIIVQSKKNNSVLECHSVTGEGSHLLKICVQNSSKLESLLKENIKFNVDFNSPNGFELKEDILNSKNKFFCKSFIDEQHKLIDKSVFNLDRDFSKKILIVYSSEYIKKVEKLKMDYPNEIYHLIDSVNIESDVQKLLKAYDSNRRLSFIESLDKKITIEHFPRSRNDIDKVYFLLDYKLGKTIVPIYRNLDFGSKLFSNTEIIYGADKVNDLADFEGILIPINKQMIERIAQIKDITNLENEFEKMMVSDYLILEKVTNNNFYSSEIYLSTGFVNINGNECISRNIPMWKIDINEITKQI